MNTEELRNKMATDLAHLTNIKNTFDVIFAEIEKKKDFDCDKFYEWFCERDIASMNYPLGFLKKCGIEDIKDGKFDTQPRSDIVTLQPLVNAMRDRDFIVRDKDISYIRKYEEYMYYKKEIPIEDIRTLNHQIISFLVEKDLKTSKTFADMVRRSKLFKGVNAPLEKLNKEVEKEQKEMNDLINQLMLSK